MAKETTWYNYSYFICCFLSKENHWLPTGESRYLFPYFHPTENFSSQLLALLAQRCHNYLAQDISHCKCLGNFGICLKILYSINGQRFEPSLLEHIWLINRMDFLAVIFSLLYYYKWCIEYHWLITWATVPRPQYQEQKITKTLCPFLLFSVNSVDSKEYNSVRTNVFSTCVFYCCCFWFGFVFVVLFVKKKSKGGCHKCENFVGKNGHL